MRGRGIGSALAGLFTRLVPILGRAIKVAVPAAAKAGKAAVKSRVGRSVLKAAKKELKKSGVNAVARALEGENVIKGAKADLSKSKKRIAKVIKQTPVGLDDNGTKRGKKRGTPGASSFSGFKVKKGRPGIAVGKRPPLL